MNILAISQVYFPDTAATSQSLTDLLEALAQKGHRVSVFTSRRKYEEPEVTFPKNNHHKGVSIYRIKNTGFGKKSKLSRLIDFLTFNFLISFKLLFITRSRYNLIIGMTSPPLLSFIGLKIARIKKIKFIYWTMDLQPELSIAAGYFNSESKVAKALQKRGDYIFRYADRIITLDKYMHDHIARRLGYNRDGIDIISIWPVMKEVYNGARAENPFRIENDFGNKIIVMYSGNHSVMHPLDTLLEAALALREDKRFLFVHIGGGVKLDDVKNYKQNHSLNNILILPYQPREKIHLSLGSADIQVVILGDNCVGYTHPNKIYGAMFIGKPILYIGPEKSHITDILENCEGNISVRHGQSDKLVDHLLKFAGTADENIIETGMKNRRYADSHFHPSTLISQMVRSVESI